ncbi:SDR family NAD(P)-dependent oxidoreductase [Streptomyces sp. NPDC006332]|uniref:SDR family NAD(P)-dependent oxidoreductase n=1 Tax=Streptomyces sp. NPDC006332 TaxID=3155456 RepID=UPI0033A5C593
MTVSSTGFTGKVAFVTGAGSGIGRVTAGAFARAGARVALADLSPDGVLVCSDAASFATDHAMVVGGGQTA